MKTKFVNILRSPFIEKGVFWVKGVETLMYSYYEALIPILDSKEINMAIHYYLYGTLRRIDGIVTFK